MKFCLFELIILKLALYYHSMSYSPCSSLNFSDEDLAEPDIKQVLDNG